MAIKYDTILGKLREADTVSSVFPASGGTFTGDVTYSKTGYIMTDSNGTRWRVTIDTLGVISTTAIVSTGMSTPWLWMFGAI
jgi:hypothetical protein